MPTQQDCHYLASLYLDMGCISSNFRFNGLSARYGLTLSATSRYSPEEDSPEHAARIARVLAWTSQVPVPGRHVHFTLVSQTAPPGRDIMIIIMVGSSL